LKNLTDLIGQKAPPGTNGAALRGRSLARIFYKTITNEE